MNPNSSATRALAALLFLVPTIAAQPVTEERPRRVVETPTLDVNFKGGTLLDLVDLLRAQNDMINIVAPELAARVPVPPMQLHSVTAEAALRAAATVVDKPFDLNVQPITEKTGGAVLALRVQERSTRAVTNVGMVSPDEIRVEVFSLRAITKALPNEPDGIVHRTATVLTAIDTGLGFVQAATKPSIKFHEDSGLLFVSATIEQIGVVSSVLNQLERSVAAARAEAVRPSGGDKAPAESNHPVEVKTKKSPQ